MVPNSSQPIDTARQLRRRFARIAAIAILLLVAGYVAIHLRTGPGTSANQQQHSISNHREERLEFANHLIHETSPYLLQHAYNPVNWFPWGPEAFAKAKQEDKPIFLSVGYSTCYWCHVMEHESFESEEVAAILNEHFIAIKVDREERPDVDAQYMLATQLMTGRAGWPNSVWLTPDGRPWMTGTYFPREQFIRILKTASAYWTDRRQETERQADRFAAAIRRSGGSLAVAGDGPLEQSLVDNAVAAYRQAFDAARGGFGLAPKFPPHGVLRVLAHEVRRTGDDELLPMLTRTLDGMWLGGIHDHLGGGFHRYSTDRDWLVPHFEKMLYDNAQLIRDYTDGFLLTSVPRYREAVEDIFTWVEREMTSPQGGFYSAIDAGDVGKEGEAYLWRFDEVLDVLGDKDGTLFAETYNLAREGNFREEDSGERLGKNIVYLDASLTVIEQVRSDISGHLPSQMAAMREKLLERRNTWTQPDRDDTILTSWNGLMIGALAYAGRQLNERRYVEAAANAADFLLDQLVDDQGRLLRTFHGEQVKLLGYLDDFAYLVEGLLELNAATGDDRWLREARRLADAMIEQFEDSQDGGFFFSSTSHDELLMRSKNLMGGGNLPAANGVAALVLVELHRLTGDLHYARSAERTLDSLAPLVRQHPRGSDSAVLATAVYLQHLTPELANEVPADGTDASRNQQPPGD